MDALRYLVSVNLFSDEFIFSDIVLLSLSLYYYDNYIQVRRPKVVMIEGRGSLLKFIQTHRNPFRSSETLQIHSEPQISIEIH